MTAVRTDRVIAAPAADVWARIADVAAISTWFPSFVSSRLEADGHRCIVLATGLELDEEIVLVDPVARRLRYRIVGGMPIVASHQATVDVIAVDADRCAVVYSTDVEPAPLAFILGGVIEEALGELDAQITGAAAGTPPVASAPGGG